MSIRIKNRVNSTDGSRDWGWLLSKSVYLFLLLLINSHDQCLRSQEASYTSWELEKMLENIKKLEYTEFYKVVKPILHNEQTKVVGYDYLGRYYMEKEVPDSTIYYGNKIFNISIDKKDPLSYLMLSKAYNMLAVGYGYKGLNNIRGWYHLKGIELYDKGLVDSRNSVHHIRGLADCYLDAKEFDKAIPLYEKSITLDKGQPTVYLSYNNLGRIYTEKKKYPKALEYLQKALDAPERLKVRGFCMTNLSSCYYEMGAIEKSITYAEEAKMLFGEQNQESKFILILDKIIAKSSHKIKEYDKALQLYQKTLHTAKKNGFLDLQMDILNDLSSLQKEIGNYKEALTLVQQSNELKDSLTQIQKDKQITQLQAQLEITEKEKEIELLKKNQEIRDNQLASEKQTKRILLISFLAISAALIFLLIVNKQKLNAKNNLSKKQEEVNQEKINSLMKVQELKLVRASLKVQETERKRISRELHDSIGGNLAAIKLGFENVDESGKQYRDIRKQLNETYHLIRGISHDLKPDKFYTNKFTNLIREYTETIAKTGNIEIVFNAYPEKKLNAIGEVLQIEMFKIIQELLTNALKHAKASKVDIQIDVLKEYVSIIFEDNGVGFDPKKKKEGMGLLNIKDRLKAINGSAKIDSVINRGTLLTIDISLKDNYLLS